MSGEWIKHDGGECPGIVSMAATVSLKFRNGKIRESLTDADLYVWDHTGHPGDIVAYRIETAAEPQQEPPPEKMGSDWVKHYGERCPDDVVDAASKGYLVELQFYEEESRITKNPLSNDWVHRGSRWDIVAYRIVETAGEPKPNPMASTVPIPDGWRPLHPDEMVKQFDVIWNAEKRRGTPVLAWGYQYKNATGVLIIRQLLSCYHRGCGSVDVGVDR